MKTIIAILLSIPSIAAVSPNLDDKGFVPGKAYYPTNKLTMECIVDIIDTSLTQTSYYTLTIKGKLDYVHYNDKGYRYLALDFKGALDKLKNVDQTVNSPYREFMDPYKCKEVK